MSGTCLLLNSKGKVFKIQENKLNVMSNDESFLVSGWEDDLNDIDVEKNPHENPEKEVLWAAENGKFDKLKSLIESDKNLINTKDDDGYTPLHRACYNDHLELVKYLLQSGADVSSKTEMEWQPLHSCCQWNRRECASILIQHGADVNAASQGGQTPLHIAASHGACYDIVQLLLMHPDIKPLLLNNSNETPIHIANRSSKYYNVFEMADPLLSLEQLETLQ